MAYLLIICDPGEADELKTRIDNAKQNDAFKPFNIPKKDIEIQVLTSSVQLNAFAFNKKRVLQIFIREYLPWWKGENRSLHGGYGAAEFVLKKLGDTPKFPAAIQFFSSHTRDQLDQLKVGYEQLMVRLFWHYDLIDRNEVIFSEIFPERKYRYFRNLCLVEAQLISNLKHDIERNRHRSTQEITEVLERLVNFGPSILGLESCNLASLICEKLKKNGDYQYEPDYETEIKNLFNLLQARSEILALKNEPIQKYKRNVLVIEDDTTSLIQLTHELGLYFENVESSSSGVQAIDVIHKKMQTGQLDAVFIDLELLEHNKFYQRVHGLDILDVCQAKYPMLTTRIVTALSRKGLRDLLGTGTDDVLYKTGTGSIIDANDNVPDILKKVEYEIIRKSEMKHRPGPKKGAFGKGFYNMYCEWNNGPKQEKLNSFLQFASEKAFDFIKWYDRSSAIWDDPDNKIPVAFPSPKRILEVAEKGDEQVFKILLLHRRVMLALAKNIGSAPVLYFSKDENAAYLQNHPAFAGKGLPQIATAYFSTNLSMSIQDLRGGKIVIVHPVPEDLFPEEADWWRTIPLYIHLIDPSVSLDIYSHLSQGFEKKFDKHKIFDQSNLLRSSICEQPVLTKEAAIRLQTEAGALLNKNAPMVPEVRLFLEKLCRLINRLVH